MLKTNIMQLSASNDRLTIRKYGNNLIYDTLKRHEESHDIIVKLNELGFSMKDSLAIYNVYKSNTLNVIDKYWVEQMSTMAHLREGIYLRQYAQDNPLRAYTQEGYDLFEKMLMNIDKDVTQYLIKAEIRQNIERKEVAKNKVTNDSDTTARTTQKKSTKVGRNDPCPCGSGKKYKQCCGK